MENDNFNKNVEKFVKWSKVCVIAANITGVFSIIPALLTILKEFTNFEAGAPYLYGKISVFIMLAIYLVLFTLMIICYIKARKYKKLIGKIENNENEAVNEQNVCDK